VTLIAAFNCSDGVLLCADSQETLGNPTPEGWQNYRCRVDKLQPRVDGYYQWVAGGAGDGDLVDGFTDRLKDDIAGWRDNLSRSEVKDELRRSLLDYRRNEVAASGFADDTLEFLICVKGKTGDPFLFKADKAIRWIDEWEIIGWDEGIYRHDIQRHYKSAQSTSFSMLLGAHVLLLAKATSNTVGGPTKIVVGNDAGLRAISESNVEELERRIAQFDSALDALRLRICDTTVPLDDFAKDLSDFHDAVVDLRVTLTHYIILARLYRFRDVKTVDDVVALNDPYLGLPSVEECVRALRATWMSVTLSRRGKRDLALVCSHLASATLMFGRINRETYETGAITLEQLHGFAERLLTVNEAGRALLDEITEITSHDSMLESEVDYLYSSLTQRVVDPLLNIATDFGKLFESGNDQANRVIKDIQAALLSLFTTAWVLPFSKEPQKKDESGSVPLSLM
jgi:hypothetical protein